jgi:hypothetical protein
MEPRGIICINPRKIFAARILSSGSNATHGTAMDMADFANWRHLSLGAIELLKGASLDLPPGSQREAVETKIKHAENMLARADAMLAKDLGMLLCDCTWPPQIMLRRQNVHVCPNPQCGRRLGGGSQSEDWEPITDDFMTS